MRPTFFHHIHPPTIPARQARLRYTLAAGGLAVFLTLVVSMTGILEVFFYIPTPSEAALSIQTLTFLVPFGGMVRNLHFWSAQLLVIITLVHLIRVVITGAYTYPRRLNYLIGMALFLLAVLLNFTGYILRWDEGIHWALVTGTNLLKAIPLIGSSFYQVIVGGTQIGPSTLLRFYGWHILGLTIISFIFMVWHVFRIRRDGGIAVPPPRLRESQQRISRYELVRREVLVMLLAAVLLLLLAVFVPAPLASPLDSTNPMAESPRAPWFFLWVQQMLKLGNPFWWGIVIPLVIFTLVALIPFLFPSIKASELARWFPRSGRYAQLLVGVLALFLLILTVLAMIPVK